MVYLLVGLVLVFDFIILRMASKCSRAEERMFVELFKKDID